MFKQLKENFNLYFLAPLKLFIFRPRPAGKFNSRGLSRALLAVIALIISGALAARFFLSLTAVDSPESDRSLLGQLKTQAQKFINIAGNNISFTDTKLTKEAEKIKAEKLALERAKLESMEQFSRVTFFYTAPYLASVAIPSAWEKKYRAREENNTIDFYYTPTAKEEYPLFQIGILSRAEWEKKSVEKNNLQIINMAGNFVFFYQIYAPEITNPDKAEDYNEMNKKLNSIIRSFKSYKQ